MSDMIINQYPNVSQGILHNIGWTAHKSLMPWFAWACSLSRTSRHTVLCIISKTWTCCCIFETDGKFFWWRGVFLWQMVRLWWEKPFRCCNILDNAKPFDSYHNYAKFWYKVIILKSWEKINSTNRISIVLGNFWSPVPFWTHRELYPL